MGEDGFNSSLIGQILLFHESRDDDEVHLLFGDDGDVTLVAIPPNFGIHIALRQLEVFN